MSLLYDEKVTGLFQLTTFCFVDSISSGVCWGKRVKSMGPSGLPGKPLEFWIHSPLWALSCGFSIRPVVTDMKEKPEHSPKLRGWNVLPLFRPRGETKEVQGVRCLVCTGRAECLWGSVPESWDGSRRSRWGRGDCVSSEGVGSGWVSQTLLAPLQVTSKTTSPPAPPPVLWGTALSQQDLKATHPRPDRPSRPQPSQRRREPELPASTGVCPHQALVGSLSLRNQTEAGL